jgi:hypothetical protein
MRRLREKAQARTTQFIGQMIGDDKLVLEGKEEQRQAEEMPGLHHYSQDAVPADALKLQRLLSQARHAGRHLALFGLLVAAADTLTADPASRAAPIAALARVVTSLIAYSFWYPKPTG